MTYSFSGPALSGLIPSVTGAILIGGLYSSIAQTNLEPISLLISRAVLDFFTYDWIRNMNPEVSPRTQAKIYAATNLTVNFGILIIFRQAQLIGALGAAFFLSLMGLELYCKCRNFSKYRAEQIG